MITVPLVIWLVATGASYQEPATTPSSGWTAVSSPEGDFHVAFPSKPREQTKSITNAAGNIEQKVYHVQTGGSLFTMQRYRFPRTFSAGQAAAQLAAEKKGYLAGNAKLIEDKKATVEGVSGEEFTYKAPSPRGDGTVTTRTRHFIKGSSYYTLSVMSPPNAPLPKEADRFLASLSFAKPAAGKAGGAAGAVEKARPAAKARPGAMAKAPAAAGGRQLPDLTPEDALRTFMVATVAQDEAALRAITLPDRELVWLLSGPRAPAEAVEQMRTLAAEMKIQRLKPGDEVKLARGRVAVIGPEEVTEDRAVLLPEGAPVPVRLQRVEGHWKLDARPAIAARKAAEAARQKGQGQ